MPVVYTQWDCITLRYFPALPVCHSSCAPWPCAARNPEFGKSRKETWKGEKHDRYHRGTDPGISSTGPMHTMALAPHAAATAPPLSRPCRRWVACMQRHPAITTVLPRCRTPHALLLLCPLTRRVYSSGTRIGLKFESACDGSSAWATLRPTRDTSCHSRRHHHARLRRVRQHHRAHLHRLLQIFLKQSI